MPSFVPITVTLRTLFKKKRGEDPTSPQGGRQIQTGLNYWFQHWEARIQKVNGARCEQKWRKWHLPDPVPLRSRSTWSAPWRPQLSLCRKFQWIQVFPCFQICCIQWCSLKLILTLFSGHEKSLEMAIFPSFGLKWDIIAQGTSRRKESRDKWNE